jgi:hypothetical protein
MATWHNVVAKKNKTRKQANVGTRQERHMKTTTTTTRKKGGRRTRVGRGGGNCREKEFLFWNEYFGNIGKVTDRLFENFCEFLGIFCDFFWAVFAGFFFFPFCGVDNKQLNFLRRRRRRRRRRGRRRAGERWEMSE